MAILFGTTATGETLPVEVNEFGQLIAEGLPGQEGPPGPPGIGQLPPDPFEGALLGWEDGVLAWVSASVPLPAGTFGPIVSYSNGIIELADSVSLLNGQAVILSDSAGDRFYYQPYSQVLAVNSDVYTVDTVYGWQVGDVIGNSGFEPVVYTGNGGTQSIICGSGMATDLVWVKARTSVENNILVDTVRGAGNRLISDGWYAQNFDNNTVSSFTSDGFVVGSSSSVNGSDIDYVAWCFDAGDTTVTNNDGTLASQVRSNGGFSVVKYSGSTPGQTYGHGLSDIPAFIITKKFTATGNWAIQHKSLPINQQVYLDSSDAQNEDNTLWPTRATSTVVSLGDSNYVNSTSQDYISYCWAESPTQSFGEYTGTGSPLGIECGFAPDLVMIKRTNGVGSWYMYDTARGDGKYLKANETAAEGDGQAENVSLNSTGFTIFGASAAINGFNSTYIYVAFSAIASTVTAVDAENGTLTLEGTPYEVGDQLIGPVKSGEGSVSLTNGSTIVLRSDNTQWLPGQYVTAPEQEIAARKVVGAQVRKSYKKD